MLLLTREQCRQPTPPLLQSYTLPAIVGRIRWDTRRHSPLQYIRSKGWLY